MKTANTRPLARPLHNRREEGAGTRLSRTVSRIALAAMLLLAAPLALAQVFPPSLSNTASISPPSGVTNSGASCTGAGRTFSAGVCSSTDTNTLAASSDLAISKTGTAAVNQGGTVTYTIRVWNNGLSSSLGAAIADTVPANLTSVSWTCAGTGAGSTCSAASGTGNNISLTANLPVDTGATTTPDTAFVTVTVTGTATTPGAIANTATVAAPAGATDPTPGNNSSTANTTISALTDLAISKTGTATVNQGGAVSYTIRVWNNGPGVATGAAITDTVPANLTSVSWTCAGTGAGSTCSAASGTGNNISLTANLPVDTGAATSADTSFVTITVTGTATTPGAITNTANVAAPAGASDPTAGNNSSSANTTIVALADLAITKGVSNSAPVVGTNVTFTLTVTNNGPSAAAAVSVADLLPAGYTYVSDNGAGAYVPGTGVWTIGSLTNAGSASLQIVATVRATGPYANTATVSSTTTDPTPGNNTATSTPTPVASADLSIVKGVSNSTPAVGTNVTFTLTVTNNGPSGAAAVSVSDQLPAGYTYVSDNGAGAYVPGTGVWTIGSLANGASTSLQVVATVRATGPYANTATVTSTTNDPTPGNNTSTSTPTPVASADLSIVKGVSNSAPAVGTNVTFTLTVTNNGPSAAAAVSVADLLPAGYTYVSDNGAGAYVPGTGAWTIGALANGASASLQIVATVRATGPYANTATVSSTTNDPTPGNNTSTSTPVPVVSSDLSIVKGVSNSTPTVGTNVTFTLTVTNNGPSPATGVSVADLLPNGYTYVSDNGAGAYVSGTGVWTIGNLANAASTSLQIVATVRATGTYANTATVSSTSNDPTPGNNTSTSTPTPVASADLSIVKGVSNSAPIIGTNVTFTLTVTNNGPSSAAAVSVADLLPAGYTYVSDNGGGAYVPGTGAWTIGTLANGGSASLQIVATVRATGPYANTATVTSTTNDPTPGNNTSTSTPVPVASADLSIVKGVSNSTPTVGTNVTFTLTVTNNGPSSAAAVSVADLLPNGYTYVSDNGGGAYVPGTGAWTIGTLANGASASLQIVATVRATGTYANTATVSSTTNDPTPGNNTSTSTPTPVASADLSIVKGVSNSAPIIGTNVTFTLTVTNNGPSSAAAVSVVDLLPNGYTYVSDNGGGAYVPGTGAWTIGTLANGASASLQIVATVRATGTYANTATVSSTTNDPTPGNNTSTSTPTPVASADLVMAKSVDNAAPVVGSNVVFTLTVTNNGPSASAGVSVADLLPNGYTYVSDSGGGAYVPGTGAWTIGTLANGASASLQITATVRATGTYANTATVSSTTNDPTPGNNTSTSTPTPVASADLALTKSVNNANPVVGANIVFTLTVTNNGPSAAAAVSVADLLPSGYTYVSDNGAGAYVSGTGVWTIGSLANGASTSLQITATVNATGTYLNSATVSSTTNDPIPGNNTGTATTTPTASADLAIRKTGPATVNQGDTVSYTIQVWNNGLSDIANATVEDTVPTNLSSVAWTCVGTGGAVCVSPSGTGDVNTNVDLPVDTGAAGSADTRYVTFTVTGTATTPGAITNTATVAVPAGAIDPTLGNDSSSANTTIVAQADLAIVKGVSNANPVVGTNVVFTLTVTNNGPSAAAAVSVADLLPNGYTYVSDDGAGAYVPGTGVWTIGNLADAASVSLQITATVNATGTYANTATVSSTTTDPTPGNNTSTSTPTPVASADLAIVKGVSNANPNVGDSVTFTLTVTNNGPSAAASVSVADQLPAGYTYVSDDSAGAYVPGTGAWTIGNLANGASVALNIVVTVNAAGPYANTATVTSATNDPTPGNNTSTSTPGPVPTADLAIVKGVSNANPVVGTNVVFTLTVTNNGPSPATAVSVADLLPNGYTYVSDNGAGAYVSGTGVWTIGSLANAASTSLQITATVNATGTYLNSATVSSTTNDPTPANNTGTATTTPVASADLAMAKSVDNATPTVGTNVVFTLTVTNNGPSAAAAVSVADLLPNGYTYVSDNGAGAYVSGTGVWTIGSLANGASTSLQITATVNATGTYANTATVTSTTNDPTPGNNTSTSTPTPVASADLAMAKSVDNATPTVGTNVVFTLTVTNNGPSASAGVSVADLLPNGYTYVSDNGAGAYVSGTGVWTIGSLANGASASLQITATVLATGTYANTATVSSTTNDPTPGNNTGTSTPTPVPSADLVMAKSVDNATPTVGTNVVFTLTVTNNGPSASAGVSVADLLPSGYTYLSDNSPGTYTPGTGVWVIGSLANGASATLQISATVNATGTYLNTATVSSGTDDPNTTNNTGTATTTPVASADLAMAKSVDNATPTVGTNVVFTLTVTNNGPSASAGVSVADLLPNGYTYVSDNGAGAYVSGTGVWTIGNLANGASASLQITASVNATGTYLNSATVSSTTNDPTTTNNTGTATTTPVASADLAMAKSVDNATPTVGTNVVFTLTVTNNGPSAAAAVSVADLLPSGYAYVSDNGAGAYVSGTGVWTIGSLANGASASLQITATVNATGTYLNSATVSSTTNDPTTTNNTGTATTTPVASADLAMAKSVDNATPTVGTNVVFTLTVTNTGPSASAGVSVADLLPSGYTYVSDNGAGAYVSGTGVWTIGNLANGASTSLQITATVNATGTYANTATVTSTTSDPTPGNNTSTSTPTPVASADLSIDKDDAGASVVPGNNVVYTLTVANAGPSAASAIVVSDAIPAGLSFVSANGAGWACVNNAGTVECSRPTLAAGANAAITLTLAVPANYGGASTISNTASVSSATSDPNGGNDSDTETTPVSISIDAVDDAATVLPFAGGTVPNVTVNDTTNGVAVAIGVNATAPTIVSNGGLTGLVANPDGSFTVPASSAPGAYTVTYRICTLPATSPATCDDASVPVVVGPDAVDDTATTPQNTTLNATVTGGDSAPVGSAYTLVTGTSNGTLTFNADGTYTYVPNANYSGPDSFSYRLCLPAPNGSVCDTATVSITVGGNTVTPVDDSASTPQNTPVGINVIGNDTTTGAPLNPASVNIVTAPTNGSVTCDAAGLCTYTPNAGFSGSDSFVYRVCDVSTPTPVCANATATVTVAQAVIVANDDDYSSTPVNGATGSANVGNALSNDSLNGGAVDLAFVTFTVNDPNTGDGVSVAADGTISVAPGTPAGTYVIPYQLCETARPSNCDTASITVVVGAAPINAVDDPVAAPVNGSTGGNGVVNVLGNDTLNGGAATTSNVTLAPVTNGPLTVNADGTVDVAPNTPAGTYTVSYQICEILNPSNCDTATVTVTVNAAPIDAVDDTVATPVNGTTGGTGVVNVLGNDTLNGSAATTSNVTLAPVTNGPLTVNANGTVDVAPNTPAGTYTATYRICEVLNPSNCDTAIVTVTVNAAPIDAVDDTVATPVNGSTGGAGVINVLGNDTLNGSALNPTDVTLTPVTSGPLTVNANGTVDVAPNTPAGTYTVTYRICEVLNPSNCDTAVVTVTVVAPAITAVDDLVGGGNGITPQNTPLVTNVLGNDTLNGAPIDPALVNITIASNPANGTVVVNSNGTVTYTPNPNFSGNDSYTYTICEKLNPANCATATVSVLVQPNLVVATDDVVTTNQQTPVAISVLGNDTVTSAPLDPASVSVTVQPANGTVNCAAGVCTYTPNQFFAGTDSFTYRVCDTSVPTPVCDTAVVTITVSANAPVLRLTKQSAQRSVKVGDLVRYTVIAENVGDSPARNATLVDTPPAGFTYVDGSLSVDDEDDAATVGGTNPLRINGIDVAIGQRATIVYFLRVGAGVGKGVHTNSVTALDVTGTSIGNVATADVDMAGDPLLEDSLIMGTVYDDRDGDGWQDPAKAGGVRVQGGFAPGAYVAGSTTVDRGTGPQPEPDASAPLLHGIAIGDIAGRNSSADSAQRRQVVVRQTLRSLDFSDDFVLTTDEGSTVRMNAAGQTTVERARGDAAKGLTAQDLQVTRQVSQTAGGYEVSYVIRNEGIDERGIPGVRIASVEGLIMQTDAYGRYHLEGISGGDAARGRNFILKVDQATLPPGSVFTTENPRVRRVTQGVPTRFDFGVKLPAGEIRGGSSQTDVELGEVMFEAGSDQVKSDYAPMFGKIAQRLREADGGSVTITAQAEGEALAFARAHAVQAALSKELEPALAEKVRIDVVAGTDASALVSLDQAIKLGELLFDTDQATIRPQYRGLISEIAKTLNREGRGVIGIVGRADPRGANAYNVQLGLRRAKAVFEAISAELEPKVRQKVRVDITDDTNAPVGVGGR